MKITGVEAIELRLPEPEVKEITSAAQDALIIKIHTDAGITGIGEVDSSPRVAKAVVEAPMSHTIATGLGRLLIGMNLFIPGYEDDFGVFLAGFMDIIIIALIVLALQRK